MAKSKQSFVDRVMNRLGEEVNKMNVSRFQGKAVKTFNNQIKIRQADIEELNEQLEELEEALADAVVDIDPSFISTSSSRASYIVTYMGALKTHRQNVQDVKDEIATKEAEIEEFKAYLALVQDA